MRRQTWLICTLFFETKETNRDRIRGSPCLLFPPRFTVDSFVTSFAFKHGSMVSSFLTPPVSKRNQEFRTKLEIWRENCAGIFNCREIAILFSNTAIIYLTLLNNAISELQHISLFDQSIVFRSKVQFPTNSILERFYTLFITLQKYN